MNNQQQQQWREAPFGQEKRPGAGLAIVALILFILSGVLHVVSLIPVVGLLFGIAGFFIDVIILILLAMIVAQLM
jgi:hypothetical protein